jgi:hypothetical protein
MRLSGHFSDGLLIGRSQVRALVGEPIFNGLGSFERLAPAIFSVIFFPGPCAESASIKNMQGKERRTLDPHVVRTLPIAAQAHADIRRAIAILEAHPTMSRRLHSRIRHLAIRCNRARTRTLGQSDSTLRVGAIYVICENRLFPFCPPPCLALREFPPPWPRSSRPSPRLRTLSAPNN